MRLGVVVGENARSIWRDFLDADLGRQFDECGWHSDDILPYKRSSRLSGYLDGGDVSRRLFRGVWDD